MTVNLIKKNWTIIVIWLIGLFLRSYRQDILLGFYYDQGRDAKMAWDIISFNNFPAIGPTTGIEGLFLGPFWYYLITPGYLFAKGNPAIASFFIGFLESLTIPLIYILLKRNYGKSTALLASSLWAFSHYLIRSSRWFSNPSPIPTFVLLIMLLSFDLVNNKRNNNLWIVSLLLGLSLQLEAASAVFFFPVLFVFFLSNFNVIKKIHLTNWIKAFIAFLVPLLPQLAFEIKNKFLITNNFIGFITGHVNSNTGKSWDFPTLSFLEKRLGLYYESFFSKLDTPTSQISLIFFVIFLISLPFIFRNIKNQLVQLITLWLFIPLFLLLFFVGNYGNLYDYYLTGFFPAFIILFSLGLHYLSRPKIRSIIYIVILVMFFYGNLPHLYNYLIANPTGPEHITLGNQLQSVDFICKETINQEYRLDVYVPPVVPHTYDYLFAWRNRQGKCRLPTNHANVHYLLYEVDPPHPERLDLWLKNYNKEPIKNQFRFGGIGVELR